MHWAKVDQTVNEPKYMAFHTRVSDLLPFQRVAQLPWFKVCAQCFYICPDPQGRRSLILELWVKSSTSDSIYLISHSPNITSPTWGFLLPLRETSFICRLFAVANHYCSMAFQLNKISSSLHFHMLFSSSLPNRHGPFLLTITHPGVRRAPTSSCLPTPDPLTAPLLPPSAGARSAIETRWQISWWTLHVQACNDADLCKHR